MQSQMDGPQDFGNGHGFVPVSMSDSGVPFFSSWANSSPGFFNGCNNGNGFAQRGCVPVLCFANGRFGFTTLSAQPNSCGTTYLNTIGSPVRVQRGFQNSVPLGVPALTGSVPALSRGVPPLAPLPQNNVAPRPVVNVGRTTIVARPAGHK